VELQIRGANCASGTRTGGLAKKHKGTLEDRSPRGRRVQRSSSFDMYLSAPVSKGLFRPAARETACRTLGRDLLHHRRVAWGV